MLADYSLTNRRVPSSLFSILEVVASTNRTKERSFQITSDQVDEQIIVNYEEVPPFSSLVSEESAEQGTPSYTSHFGNIPLVLLHKIKIEPPIDAADVHVAFHV